MLLYVLHLLLTCLPNQDWIQPSSSDFPSQIEFSSSTICPPSLIRLRLFSIWGVKWTPDLCSTCHVHRGECVACVANQLPKTLADLSLQILTTIGTFHPCGLFVRKLTRPPFRLSLALPSAWKTSCPHSKRIMHGRESCDVSPLGSCRNQDPLQIFSWYKTVQNSMHIPHCQASGASCGSATIFRADLLDRRGSTYCLAAKWVEGRMSPFTSGE